MYRDLSLIEKTSLCDYLSAFISEHKKELCQRVLNNRTRFITVVLEDIYQPHNASAVLRSCDCFGIQDVHIIEKEYEFRPSPDIALGSYKWLNIHQYSEAIAAEHKNDCIENLKLEGYKIVAMTLRENSIPLQSVELDSKIALCFGTEETGLSDEFHVMADEFVKIPMYGFTQSFNISVTVALSLFILREKLNHTHINWMLNEAERQDLLLDWLIKIIPRGHRIAEHYLKTLRSPNASTPPKP